MRRDLWTCWCWCSRPRPRLPRLQPGLGPTHVALLSSLGYGLAQVDPTEEQLAAALASLVTASDDVCFCVCACVLYCGGWGRECEGGIRSDAPQDKLAHALARLVMAPAARFTPVHPGTLTADGGQEHGGEGKVSFTEFEAWYAKSEMSVEAEMNKIFNKVDADNDGRITQEELEALCNEFHGRSACLPVCVAARARVRRRRRLRVPEVAAAPSWLGL
jgi:hypothetical protein